MEKNLLNIYESTLYRFKEKQKAKTDHKTKTHHFLTMLFI